MFIYSLLPSWEQRKDFAHLKIIIIIYYYIGNTVHWILLEKKNMLQNSQAQHSILLNTNNKTEWNTFTSFPVQFLLRCNG